MNWWNRRLTSPEDRVLALETEYGIAVTSRDPGAAQAADELARELMRPSGTGSVPRADNWLGNGGRLQIDFMGVRYTTAECSSAEQVVIWDKAGERIVEERAASATEQLRNRGIDAEVRAFKGQLSEGSIAACGETYLVAPRADEQLAYEMLLPFLATRQMLVGPGALVPGDDGTVFAFSRRAGSITGTMAATFANRDVDWGGEHLRVLRVGVGEANMSEATTLLKMGSTDLVLRMIEAGVRLPRPRVDPTAACRAVSTDISGRRSLAHGRRKSVCALGLQESYLRSAQHFVDRHGGTSVDHRVLDLWSRVLHAVDSQDFSGVTRTIDWALQWDLFERFSTARDLPRRVPSVSPEMGVAVPLPERLKLLEVGYADVSRRHGTYNRLEAQGKVERVTTSLRVFEAKVKPPSTTRAAIRGALVRTTKPAVDVTSWGQYTVLGPTRTTLSCPDPRRPSTPEARAVLQGLQARR